MKISCQFHKGVLRVLTDSGNGFENLSLIFSQPRTRNTQPATRNTQPATRNKYDLFLNDLAMRKYFFFLLFFEISLLINEYQNDTQRND